MNEEKETKSRINLSKMKRVSTRGKNLRTNKRLHSETGKKGLGEGKRDGTQPFYTLSPELAALVGAEEMTRPEIVREIWRVVKGRHLQDPNDKQYTICDADLLKVIGVERFKTFVMLKYLKRHLKKSN